MNAEPFNAVDITVPEHERHAVNLALTLFYGEIEISSFNVGEDDEKVYWPIEPGMGRAAVIVMNNHYRVFYQEAAQLIRGVQTSCSDAERAA